MNRKHSTVTPADLSPDQVRVLVDTRERTPWDLTPLQAVTGTLDCGDYALESLPHVLRIERKTLPDLLQCVGRQRKRFDRQMGRMLAFPCRMLVVETSWEVIERGELGFSKLTPSQVLGSLYGWQARGVSVVLCGDRDCAQEFAGKVLLAAARKYWKQLRRMATGLRGNGACGEKQVQKVQGVKSASSSIPRPCPPRRVVKS